MRNDPAGHAEPHAVTWRRRRKPDGGPARATAVEFGQEWLDQVHVGGVGHQDPGAPPDGGPSGEIPAILGIQNVVPHRFSVGVPDLPIENSGVFSGKPLAGRSGRPSAAPDRPSCCRRRGNRRARPGPAATLTVSFRREQARHGRGRRRRPMLGSGHCRPPHLVAERPRCPSMTLTPTRGGRPGRDSDGRHAASRGSGRERCGRRERGGGLRTARAARGVGLSGARSWR